MRIQRLLFPDTDTCDRFGMYYRPGAASADTGASCAGAVNLHPAGSPGQHGISFHIGVNIITFSRGAELGSDTYFNGFSIGKWRKYTTLDNLFLSLRLKGRFSVQLCHVYRLNLENVTRIIRETIFECAETSDFRMDLPVTDDAGMYYFRLHAETDGSVYYGGCYGTDMAEDGAAPVHLAVGICTYRREQYVIHNLKRLREDLADNAESPLFQKLEVFVSDNGKSLPDSLSSPHVRIYPNKNTGGSGGFTRVMIEVMKAREELGITHLLLMDDDVQIEPHALELTFCFLGLLKPEHRDAFLGGAMLRLDRRSIQSDNGARWTGLDVFVPKANYDMEDLGCVLANEIEDTVDYLGWWYCCMPVGVIQEDNLPIPLFIKRDDIEYSLRCGREFIALNGVCVWHETFESKSSAYLDYYYFRNMCIINARHVPTFTKKRLRKALGSYVRENLKRYQYREAELAIMGVEDFLKGVDAFLQTDGEKLNTALMKLSYKKEPVENLDYAFVNRQFEQNIQYSESKLRRKFRQITFNGWLLPVRRVNKVSDAKKQVIVPAFNAHKGLFFRAERALHYESSSGRGYVTKKSWANLRYIISYNLRINRQIRRSYDRVSREFRDRFGEYTNLEFWNSYLTREGEAPEMKSGIPEP